MIPPRQTALDILLKIEKNKSYSNILINSYLTDAKMTQRDSGFVTALVYGVLENIILLDFFISKAGNRSAARLDPVVRNILRLGAYQIIFLDRVPDSAAVNESVELAKKTGAARAAGFANAVLRKISRCKDNLPYPDEKTDLKRFLHVRYSCPSWLLDKWIKEYGAAAARGILSGLKENQGTVLRVNTLKTDKTKLAGLLADEGITAVYAGFPDNALKAERVHDLKHSKAFAQGLFFVQNTASQVCCYSCGAKPGDTVMDMCAAPGGKSFNLAIQMENIGKIFAMDLYENRLKLIKEGEKRLSLDIIDTVKNDASKHNENLGSADIVLCDVPCSGLGVIGRKPEIRYKNPGEFDGLPDLQYSIMCESSRHVKTGGTLVYSTCTLSRAENDDIVGRFLKEHKEYLPELPDRIRKFAGNGVSDEGFVTLLPHITGTDGFFIAVLKKIS